MNDAIWRFFEVNWQFDDFLKWICNLKITRQIDLILRYLANEWCNLMNFSLPEDSMMMKSVKIDDTDTRFEDCGNILISFFQVLFQTTAKQLRLTSANFDFGLADSSPFNEKSNVFSPTHNTFLSVQAQCLKITYFNPIEIWLIFLWNQSG